ncbi:hypothetical protein HJD18_13345 [Thermoleophilia bacterium SCSIO 60948]|nr:hypothetical protein HJD18_13345 [Thermoleophilia bacterium SCSIO 60948]
MVKRIAAVWIPVSDMSRAVGFYRDKLKLDVTEHDGDWSEVTAGDVTIGLNANESEGAGVEGGPVIAFQPESGIEDAVEDLRSSGVEIAGEISNHPWGRIATFKDSEGNDLQLYVPPNSD